jgi:hypothetical protein
MIELCAPALEGRPCRDSDPSDQSAAADVLLRQKPEDEEEGDGEEGDDEDDGDDDGYSE